MQMFEWLMRHYVKMLHIFEYALNVALAVGAGVTLCVGEGDRGIELL